MPLTFAQGILTCVWRWRETHLAESKEMNKISWVSLAVLMFSLSVCHEHVVRAKDEKIELLKEEVRVQKHKVQEEKRKRLSYLFKPSANLKSVSKIEIDDRNSGPEYSVWTPRLYYSQKGCAGMPVFSRPDDYRKGAIRFFNSKTQFSSATYSCNDPEESKQFKTTTIVCEFRVPDHRGVVFGIYKPTDSKRKNKAYVMKVLNDSKSVFKAVGKEITIWFSMETCLLNQ